MKRLCALILTITLCLTTLCGCSRSRTDSSQPAAEQPPVQSPSVSPQPDALPEQSEPAAEPSPEVSVTPSPVIPPMVERVEPYRFGQPVEESEPVEDSWFEDAAYVGDSRTEGLQLFSGLRVGDFLWSKGLNVFRAADREKKVVRVGEESFSILEMLERKTYGKVYIMIGINELGYSTASYEEGLRTLVDRVREVQPTAVIYLQTLPPVNETVAAASGLGSYIRNRKVNSFNEAIHRVAWEKQTALLDVAAVYRTEAGELAADMAVDGVHFFRSGYARWYEYLKTHTLDCERYAAGIPLEEPIVPVVPDPPVVEFPSDNPDPEETETPAPEVTETPAPEVTETPSPEVTESPVPEGTESPAPEVTETPAPEGTETPAPGTAEPPAPSVDPAPAESAEPSSEPEDNGAA